MDVIIKVLQGQWMYLVLAAIILGITFIVKKKIPQKYNDYCKSALVLTAVAYAVLAILFKQQDHFLLIPIIILCCELFGYTITGKVVAVLFADYLVILILNASPIDLTVYYIIFIILQIIIAVVLGILMDKHIRMVQAERKAKRLEEENGQIILTEEPIEDDDSLDEADSVQSILDEVKENRDDIDI